MNELLKRYEHVAPCNRSLPENFVLLLKSNLFRQLKNGRVKTQYHFA